MRRLAKINLVFEEPFWVDARNGYAIKVHGRKTRAGEIQSFSIDRKVVMG